MLLVFSVDRTRFIAHRARSCSNQKKKLTKRKHRLEVSLVATSDQGSAFGNRKPLKRLERNFPATLHLSLDLTLHNKILAFSVPMRCPRKLHQKNIKQESSIKTKENEPNPFLIPPFKFFGSTFLERKVEKSKP